MKVLIDADASPVKDIVIQETEIKKIPVILVANYAHFSSKSYPSHVSIVWVDKGSDQADFKILQLADKNDIIVTQDYGLASLLLPKGCTVLHHTGYEFTQDNIDQKLLTRHLSAVERRKTGRVSGGSSPKPFTQQDKENFKKLFLEKINSNMS